MRPDFKYVLPVFRLGITSIVQNGASAVSMFFIQGVINKFGINEISAYAAAYRIETILTISAVNMGASLSVFTAQNAGAKNFERCRKGLRDGFKVSMVLAAAVVAVIWAASPQFMYLLVGGRKGDCPHRGTLPSYRFPNIPLLRQPLSAHEFPARDRRDCIPGF